MNRVDRLMGYLLLFQSRGRLRARDFAARFEISERTVYRDIQALSEVGVPIVAVPGEGYWLMEGFYLPPIAFTPEEARALFLAVSLFTQMIMRGGETGAAAESAIDKIRAVLPLKSRAHIEALQAALKVYMPATLPLDLDDAIFGQLQEAIYQKRVVHIHYHAQSTNEVTERDIEPIEFGVVNKIWMVSAYCRLRQAVRAFRLDRIDHLVIKPERFGPRSLVQRNRRTGPIKAVIQVDNEAVRWVRERQHFMFVSEQPVGSDHTLMTFHIYKFEQIVWWLLSWGDQVEVLEPPELREHMMAAAAAIAARYK